MTDKTLGGRFIEARLAASLRAGRQLSQDAMAEMVRQAAGIPLWQAQWSDYERDKTEPSLAVIRAAAQLSGLTPGYIAFGAEANTTMSIEEALATGRRMPLPAKAPAARVVRKRRPKRP